jgi:transposase
MHMDVPACPGCRERDARIAELERRLAELEALVRDLTARLGINSSNSSVPPSANPLDAPKPVVKKPTGRKPGGQPGHPPHLKQLLPRERVKEFIPFIPTRCRKCDAPLPAEPGPDDPPPTRFQVAELPPIQAEITEYQGHARTCPCCGEVTQAAIPADLRAHGCGPRLTATLAYFTGRHYLPKRAAEEISEDVFDVPIALGTICALEQEVSTALEPAHAEALTAVKEAAVKNVDETSWKEAGKKRWLWVAATTTVAAFVIHGTRSLLGLATLLSDTIQGILCSDRWSVYACWPVLCRQICWAHLKRDFQKCVDRGGPAAAVGQEGLKIVRSIFKAWHLFRGGGLSRAQLQKRLDPIARHLRKVLDAGCCCADTKAATFCANLVELEPALWRFVVTEGVEPTNNHAERVLRRGVLWRKISFGCHSTAGCRFVERMLTVTQTLRLQNRNILHFLCEAVHNYRARLPIPSLIPVEG